MEKIYYIYKHIRSDTGTVFYVGKGKGDRAFSIKNRNRFWKNIVDKHGYKIEFLLKNLSNEEACSLEIEQIAFFRNLNQCEANIYSGGNQGALGVKQTEEHKQKIAEAQIGSKNHMYGKTKENHPNYKKKLHSEDQKSKWSKNRKGILASEETKIKLSNLRLGSGNSFYGKKHNKESLEKMASAKRGKPNKHSQKPVIDLSSGIVFDSAKEAAQCYNINYKTLMDKLSGRSKNNTNLSYIIQ